MLHRVEESALAKKQLRSRLRAERKRRSAENLAECEHRMCAHVLNVIGDLPLGNVAVYVSMPGEPPTGEIRTQLKQRGFRPLIPRVHGTDLRWAAETDSTEWETNTFGTQEPRNEFIQEHGAVLTRCVAIVIPALAVDLHGMRLGQGRGFYDRALEFTRTTDSAPLLIGLTFESEHFQSVPHEPHDIPVHVSVTESTVRWHQSQS